jgi:hypothetical protein
VPYKAAGAVSGTSSSSGTIAASLNGSTPVTGTTTTFPGASVTQLQIGGVAGYTGNNISGWIQRIAYWPAALTNSQLQAITS